MIRESVEYSNNSGTMKIINGSYSYVTLCDNNFSSCEKFLAFVDDVNELAAILRSKKRKGIKDA